MRNCTIVGCDLHQKNLCVKMSTKTSRTLKSVWTNNKDGVKKMIQTLKAFAKKHKTKKIIFAYEASGLGFNLYDELIENDIECFVLAPTNIPRSTKQKRNKTDEKDAQLLLEILRAHVFAGNALPYIWVPSKTIRDDREILRTRQDLGQKLTKVKIQIKSLLRQHGIKKPKNVDKNWTDGHKYFLEQVASMERFGHGLCVALLSLLRQLKSLEQEIKILTAEIVKLSQKKRYKAKAEALVALKGVGLLTAMMFLVELGDVSRFKNRRHLGAYLGLVPTSNESGDISNRKGHITRHGPARVRHVLCQAAWVRIRYDKAENDAFCRITRGMPHRRKIAIVAMMRRLAIRMWHTVLNLENDSKSKLDNVA